MKTIMRLALILCVIALCVSAQPSPSSRFPQAVTFTIAQGASTSAAVNMGGCTATALVIPVALTGTALTFTAAPDGLAYLPVFDEYNASKTISVGTTARVVVLSPSDFWMGGLIKIVSNGTEAAARTIRVVCRN